jgi:hypothetical protein
VNGLKVEEMRVDQQYGCVRIKTTAELKGAKINVAIDIGFGDAIEPGLVDMDYPSCSIFRCLILRPMRVRQKGSQRAALSAFDAPFFPQQTLLMVRSAAALAAARLEAWAANRCGAGAAALVLPPSLFELRRTSRDARRSLGEGGLFRMRAELIQNRRVGKGGPGAGELARTLFHRAYAPCGLSAGGHG